MERKSCCSRSRCVSTTPRAAMPVKMPKKEEDVKPVQASVKPVKMPKKEEDVKPVQPSVKKEDLTPVQQDVKKEAAFATAAAAAEVEGVESEVKETVVTAAVKKEEEPVKVNAGCGGGIGGRGCA